MDWTHRMVECGWRAALTTTQIRMAQRRSKTHVRNFYWNFTWQNPINLCGESLPEIRWRNINIILCDSSISRISISIMQQQWNKRFSFIEYTYRPFGSTQRNRSFVSSRLFDVSFSGCCCQAVTQLHCGDDAHWSTHSTMKFQTCSTFASTVIPNEDTLF